jgi:hypothetical protein
MKKVILIGLILIFVLFFNQVDWNSGNNTAHSLAQFNNDIKEMAVLTHTDLYNEELQKLSFQFNQEPFLRMSQRYSRKIFSSSKAKNTHVIFPSKKTVIETVVERAEPLKYILQRTELLSGSFKQAKIYVTVNSYDKTALSKLCRRIRVQYDEYTSLVICLYSETETGIALAKGENAHFSGKDIFESWLIFYSYHPVEGDYFDDEPGKYLKM